MAEKPNHKAHLTIENLYQIQRNTNLNSSKHLACWAATCMGFFSFLRSANLVPKTAGRREPIPALTRSDFYFTERGAVLLVKQTKTHQFEDSPLEIPIPRIPGSPVCPVAALQALITRAPADPSKPLFTYEPNKFITYNTLLHYIQSSMENIGYNPEDFGCHSTRSGGATLAAELGASPTTSSYMGCGSQMPTSPTSV